MPKNLKADYFCAPGDNYSKKDPDECGDKYVAVFLPDRKIYAVFDGARSPVVPQNVASPYDFKIEGKATDEWAAMFAVKEMVRLAQKHPHFSLVDLLARINQNMAARLDELKKKLYKGETPPPDKVWRPACAFAAIMLHDDGSAEIAQGADCMLVGITGDQKADLITPPQRLETGGMRVPASKLAAQLTGKGAFSEEKAKEIAYTTENAYIAANRGRYYNKAGGLTVLNGELEMLAHIVTCTLSPAEMAQYDALYLITDGVFVPSEKGNQRYTEAVRRIYHSSAEVFYRNVMQSHYRTQENRHVPVDVTLIELKFS